MRLGRSPRTTAPVAVTSHRQSARRHGKLRLLSALVATHVLAVGGMSVALLAAPPGAVDAAEGAVDAAGQAAGDSVERIVRDAAGRPYLRPVLPPGGGDLSPVPQQASGRFEVAPVAAARPAAVAAQATLTYRVEVERGLPYDAPGFAHAVDRTLADPRSWHGSGQHPLQRVAGDADFRIVLASPDTVDRLCAPLTTRGRVSCRNGDDVVINAWRWWRGAKTYGDDVAAYRTYVVNHETGHFLGHSHVGCSGPGEPAPVMHQQTLGLGGCKANPWPTAVELH
jgi:hypothetical protein